MLQIHETYSWRTFSLLALLPSLYPEGGKDTRVQLCDSWLDCRDKRAQINLHPSKWVPVTVEIKRLWLANQVTDILVQFPPQWPADKPRIRERNTIRLLHTHTHKCMRVLINSTYWWVYNKIMQTRTGVYAHSSCINLVIILAPKSKLQN